MDVGGSTMDALIGEAQSGMRLDRALADLLPDLSRERVKALILGGHVSGARGDTCRDPSAKVRAGLNFAVALPAPVPADAQAQAIALDIVHEDAHLIVLNKAAGMVVHPAAGNLDGTLV